MILFETTLGNITIELFENNAPITTANVKQYVKDGFYDGTIFHRVIDGFMIQGGGFESGMVKKETSDEKSKILEATKFQEPAKSRTRGDHSGARQETETRAWRSFETRAWKQMRYV